MKIEIHENFDSHDEMVTALEHITSLVRQGYVSGYGPGWELEGEWEEDEE